MWPIYVTFSVLKLETSRLVNPKHRENMISILVTFEVLKLDRSRLVSLKQPANILSIFVTFEVLKPLPNSIDVRYPFE